MKVTAENIIYSNVGGATPTTTPSGGGVNGLLQQVKNSGLLQKIQSSGIIQKGEGAIEGLLNKKKNASNMTNVANVAPSTSATPTIQPVITSPPVESTSMSMGMKVGIGVLISGIIVGSIISYKHFKKK